MNCVRGSNLMVYVVSTSDNCTSANLVHTPPRKKAEESQQIQRLLSTPSGEVQDKTAFKDRTKMPANKVTQKKIYKYKASKRHSPKLLFFFFLVLWKIK